MAESNQSLHDVDAVIIGLGSAGEQLAKQLAGRGWDVIGFEPGRVGGECPYVACIPSKSMLYDAKKGTAWPTAVERRNELAHGRDDKVHADDLTDAGVTLIRETARIVGELTVASAGHLVTARHVVVATGAAPVRPDIKGLDRDSVWTSADALSSPERPDNIVIIGGGPIGSELAEVYARHGSEVSLVEHGEVLSDDVEPEISASLTAHLEDLGVTVRLGAEVEAIEAGERSDRVRLTDNSTLTADRVLLAAGVEPRLDGIGLEAIGRTPSSFEVGRDGSVSGFDWLWAAGDVTPHSAWTHGASIQARAIADRLDGRAWPQPTTIMPRCIFTNPPVGVVGETSVAAAKRGLDVIVGSASYSELPRAATDEIDAGLAAIVVDRSTGAIVGASIFGPRADDLIQILTAFMASGADLTTARRTVFPFPTLSQVIESALKDAATKLGGPGRE